MRTIIVGSEFAVKSLDLMEEGIKTEKT